MLSELTLELQEQIYSLEIKKKEQEVICSNRQNVLYAAQIFAWELINQLGNQKSLYLSISKKLYAIGVQSAYVFIMKKPKAYQRGKKWIMPETLYLASYFDGKIIRSYQSDERPSIDMKHGITRFISKEGGRNLLAMPLTAENKQYGVILLETSIDQMPFIRGLVQQIGAILCFSELTMQERTIRRQLEESVRLIREQNELLSVLSSVDALTGLLNRRGFMEQVIKLNHSRSGENACFLFADIDHLKEINDSLGHSEGDHAIITAARALTDCVGSRGIVGRVGGDEFLALFLSECEGFAKQLEAAIHQRLDEINAFSGKPYYVEMSMGTKHFVLSESLDCFSIIAGADGVLYRAKKNRRPSIKKADDSVCGDQSGDCMPLLIGGTER
jgi:diguanylate cyclase (GGDEF)-like protein